MAMEDCPGNSDLFTSSGLAYGAFDEVNKLLSSHGFIIASFPISKIYFVIWSICLVDSVSSPSQVCKQTFAIVCCFRGLTSDA